ncbi:MAG: NAD(P)H-binding protein [Bryobacterales bacterium]|nr:NAD(P)H-binding protein [Bryobacterales bacterium]
MSAGELHAVTGAFGFTGRYIARRLLGAGRSVLTLTRRSPHPDPFGGHVAIAPLDFDPDRTAQALRGVSVFYNTYWVRFPYGGLTYESAVRNIGILLDACRRAGVRRIVHISITNPSEDSPFAYFRGKAEVERLVRSSGLSYAILRPALIFGPEDILINNIAWFLRRFPVFVVPGDGRYPVQPVFVEDVADLAVRAGETEENLVLDAVGPETFAFADLVREIGAAIGCPVRLWRLPLPVAAAAVKFLGLIVRDIVLTREELEALTAGLLASRGAPTAATRLSEWLRRQAPSLGMRYVSELARHYRARGQ